MVLSRREMMRRSVGGTAALLCGVKGDSPIFAETKLGTVPQTPPTKAKAKSVIQIWMWGGPSHLDTFDPKPAAGYDYCGPLNKPIRTNVDGIVIGELLPLLAKQADKYSIIRSMTHGINAHETAAYMVQTGRDPGGRLVFPSVGAVVSLFKGCRRRLPRSDSALHRADRVARAILRGRLPAVALQTLRHRRRSGPGPIRRRRHRRPRRHRPATTRPPRFAPQVEHLWTSPEERPVAPGVGQIRGTRRMS